MRAPLFALLILLAAPTAALHAQVRNTATVTVESGPDKGVHVVEVDFETESLGPSCEVNRRADGKDGWSFIADFYPRPLQPGGPMEVYTAFYVGPEGTTDEVTLVVTFPVETEFELRPYEVETRPNNKNTGRGSATFERRGEGALVKVEGETDEGVKFSVEFDCKMAASR